MIKLSSEAEKIRKNGWKQGSLIKIDKPIKAKGQQSKISPGLYLLISQDCDIQTPPVSVEPYVEIILCKPISYPDGNFTRGKNPRKIHIPFHSRDGRIYYECEAKNKFYLERNRLTKTEPYNAFLIAANMLDDFIEWLVKRYKRDAFPDSFNNRRNIKALKKILKKSHNNIKYIGIRLHTEDELPLEEIYKVVLYLLIEEEMSESEHKKTLNILEELVKELEDGKGIQVIDSDVLSLGQITLDEFLNLRLMDFDDLSFPDES